MKDSLKQVYEISACISIIILPIGWYIFFISFEAGFTKYFIRHCRIYRGHYTALQLLVSESPQISFYSFESRLRFHSVKNYLWDQKHRATTPEQLIYKGSCCPSFSLSSDDQPVGTIFPLIPMGIYFSVIGFVLG